MKVVGRRKPQKFVGRRKSQKDVSRKLKIGRMSAGATRKDIGRWKTRKVIGGQTSQKNVNFSHLRRPFTTGREEEEEDEEENFICLKSPKTSGGGWHGCRPLWHQATILVSKPLWVCKSTEVRFFFSQKKYKKLSTMLQYAPNV